MSQIAEIAIDPGYQAALIGLAYYRVPDAGTLLLSGETRIDYLQRQTTNDLRLLSASRALPDVLTSASGRILEVFRLVQIGETIALLTQPSHTQGLAAYFKKNIFFNDQVTVEDQSGSWAQLELLGPQAGAALADLGFAEAPALDEVVQSEMNGEILRAIGVEEFGAPRYLFFVPLTLADQLTSRLTDLGAISFSSSARHLLRIEAGLAGDPEFVDANTPFEIGLSRYVSDDKGCYTGQEVLARQVTYDKIVRSLVQLGAAELIPSGAAVQVDGKTVGQVSSTGVSPRLGPLALAVLRKPHEAAGSEVEIQTQTGLLAAKVL